MTSITRSFACALAGVRYAIRTQRNMKIHSVSAPLAITLGWVTAISSVEWLILLLTIMAVMAAELFNTALEALVDLVSPKYHPLAKAAKDTAAGAVLVAALTSLLVGAVIFIPRLEKLLMYWK